MRWHLILLVAAGSSPLLTGCAGVDPIAYAGLPSSSRLTADAQDGSGRVPYSYRPSVDWRRYGKVIIDPVVIYQGADNQFGDIPSNDRAALAKAMTTQFTTKLASWYAMTEVPGPATLRVKLTLTGAKATMPVIGTLTHFDIAGGLYNGIQTVRDREGLMSGSVSYAVEIYDSVSKQLLRAYVSKQYPSPMNVVASVGSLEAAEVGLEKGADDLMAQLR